ncbi:MAG: helix-turn-helix domain-containing protein [Actinophytocola sp.]|uniref:helix-turn-helix domain-containing protein n=1 Tax=Actinophytocola sp. TaxID=1872138 RepID=UPI003D6BE806
METTRHISPVVLRREIGRRIRVARNEAGLNILEAAKRLEIAGSSLSRFENGDGPVTVHLVRSMMDVYDLRLDDVLDLIRQARIRGWWKQYGISDKDFIALETGANRISTYEVTFVPGLLQTADYARALFESSTNARSAEWIANRLTVRLTRQERLTDEEFPLELDAVVHEFVLRYPVGGAAVMRTQLQHLALINELPTVTLRILPATIVSNESMYGGFTVLDFPTPGQPSICNSTHALGEERKDKSEYVEPARLRFGHLRSLALDPTESVALIDRVAEELWSS